MRENEYTSARRMTRRTVVGILAASSGTAVLGTVGYSFLKSARREGPSDLAELDLMDAARGVRNRSLSPVELTQVCLKRIERYNPRLNAFITVTTERALGAAHEAEREIANGHWRGPFHEIPIAAKDNIDTAGVRTTAASAVFEDRVPVEDAEVIRRLKSAGAVFLGKLNMHEFALGTTSAISHFGLVHNPRDSQSNRRRLLRRNCRSGCGFALLRGGGDRHGRLQSNSRCLLRGGRIETDFRCHQHARSHPCLHLVRSRGPDVPHRGRHRIAVSRDDRPTCRGGLPARKSAACVEPPRWRY